MFKRLSSISVLLLLFSFPLYFSTGCGYKKEQAEVVAFIESYFDTIGYQEFNSLLSFYSDKAFGVVSPSKALRGIKKAQHSFGRLKSFKLDESSVIVLENEFGVITAKLTYNVVYYNVKTKENFSVVKGKGRRGWLIYSHLINRKKHG